MSLNLSEKNQIQCINQKHSNVEPSRSGSMSVSSSRSPANACSSCPCFLDCESNCLCGRRCEILTSMTTTNSIRRFARCKRFGMTEGCNHFEWIDDALCDRLRSMMVALMIKNEALANEIDKLQKLGRKAKLRNNMLSC